MKRAGKALEVELPSLRSVLHWNITFGSSLNIGNGIGFEWEKVAGWHGLLQRGYSQVLQCPWPSLVINTINTIYILYILYKVCG